MNLSQVLIRCSGVIAILKSKKSSLSVVYNWTCCCFIGQIKWSTYVHHIEQNEVLLEAQFLRRFWHVPYLDKTFQTVARAVWPQGSKFVLRQSFFGQKSREDGTFSLPIIILSFAQYGKETENRKVWDIKCLENGYTDTYID